ncbi:flagellar hook-length control protein FliK [Bacillus sp. AG4(2022)]|uniref:flagellar hook-length control protein FliK n=1 Tax=Bacillus sp. AG4(2022) TaxID=2962594 RepID=UPI00288250DE|nr:flagellar hook-length control protein FliK [Bacillus sp. AG4(2022)]MDT0159386.1 flagellar hook-length control protein FliK [Bacillus sp. AG4(2022)]
MQLTGLGAIVSAGPAAANAGKTEAGQGFTAMMSMLLAGQGEIQQESSGKPREADQEALMSLAEFMSADSLLDLEGGHQLLDQLLSGKDTGLLEQIQSYLGLSDERISSIVTDLNKYLSDLTGKQADEHINIEQLPYLENIMHILAQLTALPENKVAGLLSKELIDAAKIVKLYDLLQKNADFAGEQPLAKGARQLLEKLDAFIMSAASKEKLHYLQKTYTQLSNDLNLGRQKSNEGKYQLPDGGKTISRLDAGASSFTLMPQMTKVEHLTLMQSNQGKMVSTEQLIEQFESILAKSQLTKTGGVQRMFLRLNPENLGSLRIELIQKDSQLTARILTSTGAAKEMLDSQVNGLKQALHSQNIQVERIEISQQLSQQERMPQRDAQQQQQGQNQPDRQKQQAGRDEESAGESFEEILLNTEA